MVRILRKMVNAVFLYGWPDNGEMNFRTRGRSLAAHLEVLGNLLQELLRTWKQGGLVKWETLPLIRSWLWLS